MTYKIFFASITLITLALKSEGQTNILDVGVEGGGSVVSLRGNESLTKYHHPRMGYCGGLFVQYNFKKIFSLRTGGYYDQKGSSFKIQLTDQYGNPGALRGKEYFDYLTIPVLLRATFGKRINYFINAGPYVGILLKQTTHEDAFNALQENNFDGSQYYHKADFGLSGGLGFSYSVQQNFSISFEVRENLGLINTSAVAVYNRGSIKTNSFNILLGVNYKLKKRKS
jgi:hypothetical protein